jgi:hypothetical protein
MFWRNLLPASSRLKSFKYWHCRGNYIWWRLTRKFAIDCHGSFQESGPLQCNTMSLHSWFWTFQRDTVFSSAGSSSPSSVLGLLDPEGGDTQFYHMSGTTHEMTVTYARGADPSPTLL